MAHIHPGRIFPYSSARRTRTSISASSSGFLTSNSIAKVFSKRIVANCLVGRSRLSQSTKSLLGIDTVFQTTDNRFPALQQTAPSALRSGFALPTTRVQRFIAASIVEQIETIVVRVAKTHQGAKPIDQTA